jgi:hypothetical protein
MSRKLNEDRRQHAAKGFLRPAFLDKEEACQIWRVNVAQKFVNNACTESQVRETYETITNTRYLNIVLPLPAVIAAAE